MAAGFFVVLEGPEGAGKTTQPGGALRLLAPVLGADPRITRVESLVDVDPRLTLEQYQLLYGAPGGPPDRFVQASLGGTTRDGLSAFTIFMPYGPNRDEARDQGRELARARGRSRHPTASRCW